MLAEYPQWESIQNIAAAAQLAAADEAAPVGSPEENQRIGRLQDAASWAIDWASTGLAHTVMREIVDEPSIFEVYEAVDLLARTARFIHGPAFSAAHNQALVTALASPRVTVEAMHARITNMVASSTPAVEPETAATVGRGRRPTASADALHRAATAAAVGLASPEYFTQALGVPREEGQALVDDLQARGLLMQAADGALQPLFQPHQVQDVLAASASPATPPTTDQRPVQTAAAPVQVAAARPPLPQRNRHADRPHPGNLTERGSQSGAASPDAEVAALLSQDGLRARIAETSTRLQAAATSTPASTARPVRTSVRPCSWPNRSTTGSSWPTSWHA
ncbi:hypothetical protein [Streptomyces sp. CA-106131]|uniref:hypothetical protein n=1 Tax=Streptomyces sp. CA-106131 TaxID=3240045 RepID=UPI003D8EF57C